MCKQPHLVGFIEQICVEGMSAVCTPYSTAHPAYLKRKTERTKERKRKKGRKIKHVPNTHGAKETYLTRLPTRRVHLSVVMKIYLELPRLDASPPGHKSKG